MGVASPRLLGALGDASYSLYLSHVLVISAVGRVYARFLLPKLGVPLGAVLCISIAIVAGYLSYRLVERPLNELLKRALLRSNRVSVA
jgi:peptidoglycan/LPS O-acetylase OafA/YrhL